MPLLEEIINLAESLSPGDIPRADQVPKLVGALIKHLEHEGHQLAEELFPEPTVPPTPASPVPGQQSELNDLFSRLEAAVVAAERAAGVTPSPTPAEASAPAPATGAEASAAASAAPAVSPGTPEGSAGADAVPPATSPTAPPETSPAAPAPDPGQAPDQASQTGSGW